MSSQVVLITGGLTGIGRAAAVAFAKKGAKVVVAGRRDEAGKALVKAYREDSPENRTFNRSCHLGAGRGGDLVQSRAGCKQVSDGWTTRNTAPGLSTPECQNL
jgi:NAD(P)-dependent dehydrogenase (short-subunit alcohol dehydrogenase family)